MKSIRWSCIFLFLLISLASLFYDTGLIAQIFTIVSVLALLIVVLLHGTARYGMKNTLIFLGIAWVISHFFEALSIRVGFPFGHYYYDQVWGPWLFDVPLIIMLAYFGMGYLSWILSCVLLRQYAKKLRGLDIFLVPFIATFIMVMWDLCMDPLSSTISSMWIWRDGGPYFGVPLQNYFGWFFVVYLILQTFALYISKADTEPAPSTNRLFWMEAVALYGIQSLQYLLAPLTLKDHAFIYQSMALVAFFTMIFVTLLSWITLVREDTPLKAPPRKR